MSVLFGWNVSKEEREREGTERREKEREKGKKGDSGGNFNQKRKASTTQLNEQ